MLKRAGAAFWDGANRPAPCCALQDPAATWTAAPSQRQSTGVQQLAGDTGDFTWGSTFTPICTLVVPALALSTLPLIPLAVQ